MGTSAPLGRRLFVRFKVHCSDFSRRPPCQEAEGAAAVEETPCIASSDSARDFLGTAAVFIFFCCGGERGEGGGREGGGGG